jgi:putative protein kinase ArgK-like GTPase of G3E family
LSGKWSGAAGGVKLILHNKCVNVYDSGRKFTINDEQEAVVEYVRNWGRGKNDKVLITGKPGTGKSFVVSKIVESLRSDHSVAILGSTALSVLGYRHY